MRRGNLIKRLLFILLLIVIIGSSGIIYQSTQDGKNAIIKEEGTKEIEKKIEFEIIADPNVTKIQIDTISQGLKQLSQDKLLKITNEGYQIYIKASTQEEFSVSEKEKQITVLASITSEQFYNYLTSYKFEE